MPTLPSRNHPQMWAEAFKQPWHLIRAAQVSGAHYPVISSWGRTVCPWHNTHEHLCTHKRPLATLWAVYALWTWKSVSRGGLTVVEYHTCTDSVLALSQDDPAETSHDIAVHLELSDPVSYSIPVGQLWVFVLIKSYSLKTFINYFCDIFIHVCHNLFPFASLLPEPFLLPSSPLLLLCHMWSYVSLEYMYGGKYNSLSPLSCLACPLPKPSSFLIASSICHVTCVYLYHHFLCTYVCWEIACVCACV